MTECKLDVVADVAFIVDQSSSIRYRSFHLMRNFLNNTIIGLDVGKGKIKVALILYSDVPRADIYFNTYEDKDDILRYIQSIAYGSGKTNTGAALTFAKDKVFTKARGSRRDQGVQQVAIVITDGKSTDDVASAAAALRRSGVTVFALGIEDTQESELKKIASYPARKFVFNVEHFNGLNSLAKILPRTLCNAVADAVIPVRLNAVEEGLWGIFTQVQTVLKVFINSSHIHSFRFFHRELFFQLFMFQSIFKNKFNITNIRKI